jgi:hypothetical protein
LCTVSPCAVIPYANSRVAQILRNKGRRENQGKKPKKIAEFGNFGNLTLDVWGGIR